MEWSGSSSHDVVFDSWHGVNHLIEFLEYQLLLSLLLRFALASICLCLSNHA